VNKGTVSGLSAIFGMTAQPDYTTSVSDTFGRGFTWMPETEQEFDMLTIEKNNGCATFSDMNKDGYVKITFKRIDHESRTLWFDKKEMRIIANYLNELLEEE
jgi:hypothetical protein